MGLVLCSVIIFLHQAKIGLRSSIRWDIINLDLQEENIITSDY